MPIIYNQSFKGGSVPKAPKVKHIFRAPTFTQPPKFSAQNSAQHKMHMHNHHKVPNSTSTSTSSPPPYLRKNGNQPYKNLKTGTLQRIRQRAESLKQGVLSGARSVSRGAQIVSNAAITGSKFVTNLVAAPGRVVYRIGTAAAIAPGQIVHRSIDKIKEMRLKSINTKATNKLLGLEQINTSTPEYKKLYYEQQRASNKLALHQAVSKQRSDMVKGYLGNTSSIFAAKKSSENTQSLKNMILGRSKKINKVKLYNNLLHPTKKLSAVQEAAAAYEKSKQANIIERNNNTTYSIRNKNGHRVINTTTGKKKTKLTIKQILENPAEIEKYSTYLHGQKNLTSKQALILETFERQKIINAAKRREVYLENIKPTQQVIPVVIKPVATPEVVAVATTPKLSSATHVVEDDATAKAKATIAATDDAAATKALDDATERARANAATKNLNKLTLTNTYHLEKESSSNNITHNKTPTDLHKVVDQVVAPVVAAPVVAPVVKTPVEELKPEAESLYAPLPDYGYMESYDISGFEGPVNPSSPLKIENTIHHKQQINTLNNNGKPDPDKIQKQIKAEAEAANLNNKIHNFSDEPIYLDISKSSKEIADKREAKREATQKLPTGGNLKTKTEKPAHPTRPSKWRKDESASQLTKKNTQLAAPTRTPTTEQLEKQQNAQQKAITSKAIRNANLAEEKTKLDNQKKLNNKKAKEYSKKVKNAENKAVAEKTAAKTQPQPETQKAGTEAQPYKSRWSSTTTQGQQTLSAAAAAKVVAAPVVVPPRRPPPPSEAALASITAEDAKITAAAAKVVAPTRPPPPSITAEASVEASAKPANNTAAAEASSPSVEASAKPAHNTAAAEAEAKVVAKVVAAEASVEATPENTSTINEQKLKNSIEDTNRIKELQKHENNIAGQKERIKDLNIQQQIIDEMLADKNPQYNATPEINYEIFIKKLNNLQLSPEKKKDYLNDFTNKLRGKSSRSKMSEYIKGERHFHDTRMQSLQEKILSLAPAAHLKAKADKLAKNTKNINTAKNMAAQALEQVQQNKNTNSSRSPLLQIFSKMKKLNQNLPTKDQLTTTGAISNAAYKAAANANLLTLEEQIRHAEKQSLPINTDTLTKQQNNNTVAGHTAHNAQYAKHVPEAAQHTTTTTAPPPSVEASSPSVEASSKPAHNTAAAESAEAKVVAAEASVEATPENTSTINEQKLKNSIEDTNRVKELQKHENTISLHTERIKDLTIQQQIIDEMLNDKNPQYNATPDINYENFNKKLDNLNLSPEKKTQYLETFRLKGSSRQTMSEYIRNELPFHEQQMKQSQEKILSLAPAAQRKAKADKLAQTKKNRNAANSMAAQALEQVQKNKNTNRSPLLQIYREIKKLNENLDANDTLPTTAMISAAYKATANKLTKEQKNSYAIMLKNEQQELYALEKNDAKAALPPAAATPSAAEAQHAQYTQHALIKASNDAHAAKRAKNKENAYIMAAQAFKKVKNNKNITYEKKNAGWLTSNKNRKKLQDMNNLTKKKTPRERIFDMLRREQNNKIKKGTLHIKDKLDTGQLSFASYKVAKDAEKLTDNEKTDFEKIKLNENQFLNSA